MSSEVGRNESHDSSGEMLGKNTVREQSHTETETVVEDVGKTPANNLSVEDKGDNSYYPEEEVLEGDWMRPQVDIKEVEVRTGEEEESCFWTHRAKLYRWAKETSEWKQRGIGDAKLLQHNETQKIRFLLRQEKTLKIVANHYVIQYGSFCQLKPNVGSEKIWVWSVMDFSEESSKLEQFALKFGQASAALEFKRKFEEAAELNKVPFKSFLEKTVSETKPSE